MGRSKREENIRMNPAKVCFDDLDYLLREYGFTRRRGIVPQYLYTHADINDAVNLPAGERNAVQSVLDGMQPHHREIWLLREHVNLGLQELAEILNISRPSVKARLFRAREEFRQISEAMRPIFATINARTFGRQSLVAVNAVLAAQRRKGASVPQYPLGIADDDDTTGVVTQLLSITSKVEELARPYRMVVWQDEKNGWAATIPDLPGLAAAGDTLEEMIAIAEEVKRLWLAAALADGKPIPTPHEQIVLA